MVAGVPLIAEEAGIFAECIRALTGDSDGRGESRSGSQPRGRSALDIVAKTWQAQTQQQQSRKARENMINGALQNVKVLMLAGADTTTAATCYTLRLPSSNPRVLGEVRAEHTAVSGQDTGATEDIIPKSPENLNALPYTLAVIKKYLRICPFALTVRQGSEGFNIFSADGMQFPLKHLHVQTGVWNIHLDPTYWPRVEEFLP
ncbi:hypothetical protein DL768_006321 [Monosporascus sp. mg162]|nr:hypothetical protein DL768_006321 [Monosporascus sp. mg162]